MSHSRQRSGSAWPVRQRRGAVADQLPASAPLELSGAGKELAAYLRALHDDSDGARRVADRDEADD